MYSKEEIKQKLILTEPDDRDPYFAHLFCEVILEKSREETNEEEYFEALIFVSYLIYSMKSSVNEESNNQLLEKFLNSFWDFYVENVEYLDLSNVLEFAIKRFEIIRGEWKEMGLDDNYLTPILIYNLYLYPLNEQYKSSDEIMSEFEFDVLLKYCVLFRTKLKHLLEALKSIQ
jgi:hypothetical protein